MSGTLIRPTLFVCSAMAFLCCASAQADFVFEMTGQVSQVANPGGSLPAEIVDGAPFVVTGLF